MATPGLGSDNMSEADKKRIHEAGGKASGGTNRTNTTSNRSTITNKSGGGRLTKDDQRKGGRS